MRSIILALLLSAVAQAALVGTPVKCAGAEPQACSYTRIGASNFLVVWIYNGPGDNMSVDATGLTFTQISVKQTANGDAMQGWTAPTVASGAITVNCHGQFGDIVRCFIQEFSGLQATPLDTSAFNSAATGTAMSSGAFTTTVTGTVVGFGCSQSASANVVTGSGYTLASPADLICGVVYKTGAAAGSQNALATAPGSAAWSMQGAGLKETAAATGSNTPAHAETF